MIHLHRHDQKTRYKFSKLWATAVVGNAKDLIFFLHLPSFSLSLSNLLFLAEVNQTYGERNFRLPLGLGVVARNQITPHTDVKISSSWSKICSATLSLC